jgi:hypothetical protein
MVWAACERYVLLNRTMAEPTAACVTPLSTHAKPCSCIRADKSPSYGQGYGAAMISCQAGGTECVVEARRWGRRYRELCRPRVVSAPNHCTSASSIPVRVSQKSDIGSELEMRPEHSNPATKHRTLPTACFLFLLPFFPWWKFREDARARAIDRWSARWPDRGSLYTSASNQEAHAHR